jgi:hypothetical protein
LEKSHGRIERRTLTVFDATVWPSGALYSPDWPGLKQFLKLEREVREHGQTTTTISYAVTSVPPGQLSPAQWLRIWRDHWGIENRCFYVRDVTLGEDACRVRTAHAPLNLATIRNAALTLLHQLGTHNIAHALRQHLFEPQLLLQRLGLARPKDLEILFPCPK